VFFNSLLAGVAALAAVTMREADPDPDPDRDLDPDLDRDFGLHPPPIHGPRNTTTPGRAGTIRATLTPTEDST